MASGCKAHRSVSLTAPGPELEVTRLTRVIRAARALETQHADLLLPLRTMPGRAPIEGMHSVLPRMPVLADDAERARVTLRDDLNACIRVEHVTIGCQKMCLALWFT